MIPLRKKIRGLISSDYLSSWAAITSSACPQGVQVYYDIPVQHPSTLGPIIPSQVGGSQGGFRMDDLYNVQPIAGPNPERDNLELDEVQEPIYRREGEDEGNVSKNWNSMVLWR